MPGNIIKVCLQAGVETHLEEPFELFQRSATVPCSRQLRVHGDAHDSRARQRREIGILKQGQMARRHVKSSIWLVRVHHLYVCIQELCHPHPHCAAPAKGTSLRNNWLQRRTTKSYFIYRPQQLQ